VGKCLERGDARIGGGARGRAHAYLVNMPNSSALASDLRQNRFC
jgi:hypothetical protein